MKPLKNYPIEKKIIVKLRFGLTNGMEKNSKGSC